MRAASTAAALTDYAEARPTRGARPSRAEPAAVEAMVAVEEEKVAAPVGGAAAAAAAAAGGEEIPADPEQFLAKLLSEQGFFARVMAAARGDTGLPETAAAVAASSRAPPPPEPHRTCAVCMSEVPLSCGLQCPLRVAEHFLCDDCLARKVESDCKLTDDNDIMVRQGNVFCIGRTMKGSTCFGARGRAYSPVDLAKHVPPAVFELYNAAQRELLVAQLSQQHEDEVRRRVDAEVKRLLAQSEQERRCHEASRHVTEDILTPR
jgi:hypothetical protein